MVFFAVSSLQNRKSMANRLSAHCARSIRTRSNIVLQLRLQRHPSRHLDLQPEAVFLEAQDRISNQTHTLACCGRGVEAVPAGTSSRSVCPLPGQALAYLGCPAVHWAGSLLVVSAEISGDIY